MILWSHTERFTGFTDQSVDPDPPSEHGRVPARARCVFCGEKLPRIGVHPYSLDVGDASPPNRYWAHANCIQDRFGPIPAIGLLTDAGDPKE